MDRQEIIEKFNLKPLIGEGGFYRQTYRDKFATCIYFLVGGDQYSALHRLTGAEIYHWYAGAPLELFTIDRKGSGQITILGSDFNNGQQPQAIVEGGVWQGSRSLGNWTLVGTTMAPGYRLEDFELANSDLLKKYEKYSEWITRLLPQ